MLQAEDAIKVGARAGQEGRSLFRGRDAELPVELRDVAVAHEAVGLFERRDALESQFLRQTPLPSAEATLATASGLRRVSRDHLNVQLPHGPPDLGERLAVDRLPGLRREPEVARPVRVERAEDALPLNDFPKRPQDSAGGLLRDQLRVVDAGGGVVEDDYQVMPALI